MGDFSTRKAVLSESPNITNQDLKSDVTVSTSAVELFASNDKARVYTIDNRGSDPIRIALGQSPTSSQGEVLEAGGDITLKTSQKVEAIRDSNASSDVTVALNIYQ